MPVYSRRQGIGRDKVSTIPRAVLLLGFSTVRNLALGVKVWDTLGTGVSRKELLYWDTVRKATSTEHLAGLEQSTLGVDHAEVGSSLLEAWNLPALMVEAVRRHHDTDVRTGFAGTSPAAAASARHPLADARSLSKHALPRL